MELCVVRAQQLLVCCVVVVAAVVDARTRTIPNGCVVALLGMRVACMTALALCGVDLGQLLSFSLVGACAVAVPLALTLCVAGGGIGGGDIKLLVALGFTLGLQHTVVVIFLACVLTVLVGCVLFFARRHAKTQPRLLGVTLPMAPQIAVALIITSCLF